MRYERTSRNKLNHKIKKQIVMQKRTIDINGKTYSTLALYNGTQVNIIATYGSDVLFEYNGGNRLAAIEEVTLLDFEPSFPIYLKYDEVLYKLLSKKEYVGVRTYKEEDAAVNTFKSFTDTSTAYDTYLQGKGEIITEQEFSNEIENARAIIWKKLNTPRSMDEAFVMVWD